MSAAGEALHLRCGAVAVRPWVEADATSLALLADNRAVWRNLDDAFPHPYGTESAVAWIAYARAMPDPSYWAIDADGLAIGGIGLQIGGGIRSRTAELGYWLGEPYWNRGFMSAAVRALVPVAMERFRLVRVEAPVFEWNPASMRVLEKCGFAREGVMRASAVKDGQLIDRVLYSFVRIPAP